MMRIGVVFPQTEIGADAGAVRAYAEHVEGLGFAHLLAYDHVVGADPTVHADWNGPYDVHTTFHEPLVTFGYLAAVTTTLELVTGVVILPQRQTVLVAKQAAEVDLLSGGRLRLGVGLGWNAVEYEALGEDFSTRGKRCDEQVTLMRKLWTEPSVTYQRQLPPGDGRGAGAAADPAADPGVVRRSITACVPAGRPARRRLVSDGRPRTQTRAGASAGGAGGDGGRPGSGSNRYAGPGFLERERRRPRPRSPDLGGCGRLACIGEHHERRIGLSRPASQRVDHRSRNRQGDNRLTVGKPDD